MEAIAAKAQGIVEYQEQVSAEVERLLAEVDALAQEYQRAKKETQRLHSLELELKARRRSFVLIWSLSNAIYV